MRYCPDCSSTHMGLNPCGMTYAQRLSSVRLDPGWMPAREKKNYFDDEELKPLFGGVPARDRKELMLEETQGVGFADQHEIAKEPELVNAHYLENPLDAEDEE